MLRREEGFHIYRNEIHDAPYSGIIARRRPPDRGEPDLPRHARDAGRRRDLRPLAKSVLRGNMVRDIVKMGEGYGVSAYYLDEGAHDCVVERNVSMGVERPTHNHIARNMIIRDNVFIADQDMTLSFQRSADCAFTGNTLFVPGKITISPAECHQELGQQHRLPRGRGQGRPAAAFHDR